MNRFFLLFAACCLISCGTSKSVSPLFGGTNATMLLETNDVPREPIKSKAEDKAIVLLNQLFNSDDANKKMVLLISNDSDCDLTMNILGGKSYTIPVASRKTESVVVERGEYVMRSEVCKSPYLSRKILSENTQVNIKYSFVSNTQSIDTENNDTEIK